MTTIRRHLKLMMWNAQTLRRNDVEFKQFLHQNQPHIVSVSETRLSPQDRFSVPGYTVYRKDRNRAGGGGGS